MNTLITPTPYRFTATDRFPLSGEYRKHLPAHGGKIREPEPALHDAFSERHLHCVWFDDRLRPETLSTARGENVRVIRPGRWNFEAGPDFLDAEWVVGGRRVRGDVEIHIRPMDWRHHEHHHDPRYQNVRLHVTYESGTLPPGSLPPDCEEVSIKTELDARSHFFFDSIDTKAYPFEVEGGLSALRMMCEGLDEEKRGGLLDAAGQERLRRKTLRMARVIQSLGPEEALYQAVMRALGYKHNADAFEETARNLPLHELRANCGEDAEAAYALLTGVADLLPHDEESAGFPPWADVGKLWKIWWRRREHFTGRTLTSDIWRLDACRPGNHPLRRLRASAEIFTESPPFEQAIQPKADEPPKKWVRRCKVRLQVREPGEPSTAMRLVGPERAAAILVNAILPWRAVMIPEELPLDLLHALPREPGNAIARRAAHALFGPDHHPRLWRDTLRKQGLLQFHEDFGI